MTKDMDVFKADGKSADPKQQARETECRVRKLAREIFVASMSRPDVEWMSVQSAFSHAEAFEAHSEERWGKLQ